MKLSCYFEPRDLWVGVYWDRRCLTHCKCATCSGRKALHVYVCLLPTLVIRVIL